MENLSELRQLMVDRNIQAYIVPSEDEHQSEYVSESDSRRQFVSGFDGSAGTAVITLDGAFLWTDGRYFIQAEKQLQSGWTLMRAGLPHVPSVGKWLAKNVHGTIGADPKLLTAKKWLEFENGGLELNVVEENLVDLAWKNKPSRPTHPVYAISDHVTGESSSSKIQRVRDHLQDKGLDVLVVSDLADVAWMLNCRGSDIPYNPVFFAYLAIFRESAILYVNASQCNGVISLLQTNSVLIRDYHNIFYDLRDKVCGFDNKVSYALYRAVGPQGLAKFEYPIARFKAVKNPAEIHGFRESHIRDGVAVCKFLCWLEEAVSGPSKYDEVDVATRLEEFRRDQEKFMGPSFATISGYGPNGAIIHYKPSKPSAAIIDTQSLYLCDSGGQYLDGTTDVTRTVHFGEPTPHEKKCFTLVLKGHISLARISFPKGATGSDLDVLARQHLWKHGMDYFHSTGHGVGHFLNVHEGPHSISGRASSTVCLEPGMVVTNEPGCYEEGKFGIRIENVMLILPNPHHENHLCFETLTMVPMQKKLMDLDLLDDHDLEWINKYHQTIYKQLAPLLSGTELEWLQRETSVVSRLSQVEDCLFCRIVQGRVPCYKIYEDNLTIAFLDIAPLSMHHVLVVPKSHGKRLHDLDNVSLKNILLVCKTISGTFDCDYNLLQNNGPLAQQTIDHVHFHLIPRPDLHSGLEMKWDVLSVFSDQLQELAAAWRRKLQEPIE